MHRRWTEEAANDLERIADYLLLHAPDRAPELIRAVHDAPSALLTFPNRGRPEKREGTRDRSAGSNRSTIPSARKCYQCLWNNLSPMCQDCTEASWLTILDDFRTWLIRETA